jgi:hypothetical protein
MSKKPSLVKKPNEDECLAKKFLVHRGHSRVTFEPGGRDTTPDFLVDEQVAVEVRRLNQSFESSDGRVEGLEQQQRGILTNLRKLALSLKGPSSVQAESWFLCIHFRRSIDDWENVWKSLRPKLRDELKIFMKRPVRSECEIRLSRSLKISIHPASWPHPTFFVMAGSVRGSVWVLPEMVKNIQLCIVEKVGNITRSKYKDKEWWLILIDRTGLVFDEDDYNDVCKMMSLRHTFKRVIIINPRDHTRAF